MNISLIAAISKNYVIGNNNNLLWKIPSDLKRFKELTTGNTIIMGRNTYDSIGKPLPNRKNFVISKNLKEIPGTKVFSSIENAIKEADDDVFIIGGGQIYAQALVYVKKFFMSIVDVIIPEEPGMIFFPKIDFDSLRLQSEEYIKNEKDEYPYFYRTYTK